MKQKRLASDHDLPVPRQGRRFSQQNKGQTPRNAICIVVDGLRASALGTYGNTWYGTSSLDRFAAQSTVAEWMMINAFELELFYRSVWEGVHALRPMRLDSGPVGLADSLSLPMRLATAGIQQTLVTDDLWLDGHAGRMPVPPHLWDRHWLDTETDRLASTIDATALGKVFAAAIERFEAWPERRQPETDNQPNRGHLLWLHARGMHGPWDAPEAMRWELVEEDEPHPPAWVLPPKYESGADPDQWLGLRIAYAAQAMVLDQCLGALLAAVDEMGDPVLLMLVGARGFSLGEHGSAGSACRELHGELMHVPWLLRVPGEEETLPARFAGLTQPADLAATLSDWFGLKPTGDGHSLLAAKHGQRADWRQVVVAQDAGNQRVVRTPAWMLKEQLATDVRVLPPQLYSKPDDRWEVNDVASRCQATVGSLLAVLAEHERRFAAALALQPFDLDSELLIPQS